MTLSSEQSIIFEDSSGTYTATLLQNNDDPTSVVPASSLVSLTLTLYDVVSGEIINQRDNQDVLNTNNVTVDEQGALEWQIQPEDNPIINTELAAGETEEHIALFTWEWSRTPDPNGKGREQVRLSVKQLDKVGT